MENRKRNKLRNFILTILIGGAIGFLIGILTAMIEVPPEYMILPWYSNVFIVLILYILAVGIHELGHAFSFSKNGIKMRAIFITVFLFIKENGRWKLKLRPNNVTLIGGIAIPDVEVVKNNEDIDRLQKTYAKAILAGPLASISLWGVLTILSVLLMVLSPEVISSISFTVAAAITFITMFLLGSCFVKSEVAIGDFPAYELAKRNRFFVAMQLYQYSLFSTDYETVRAGNTFLRRMLIEGLETKLEEKDIHIYTLGLIDQLVTEYLSDTLKELPQVVWNYIDFLTEDQERLAKLQSTELSLGVYFHIIQLLYTRKETKEKAIHFYTTIKNELKPSTTMRIYLLKQTEHALGLHDNSAFLNDKNNICISPAHGIWKNFDGYFDDELKLNQDRSAIQAL
ncbi:M50 family metallopeptidase [Aquibacillus koreensis]|uniref:M50 family metallopeptidase n=1 Tax=Aquibacillus koreensis TaxID=279446 RepID=A0A9X4AGX1_9BACI|nr:M50 family metallopeptidase [Aquibacillus koreensis]MCT2536531.1 M50 family metallopeptidase [Aquibacillus koreensis]MDC3419381.1 M50 family metallopeptidase [Aquibacillus koreensis]